jgi:GNAT superfamily N-acetyltransferase
MHASTQLRRLEKDDARAIETHLLALDPISRNRRFLSGFGDAAIVRYVRDIDFGSDVILGAIDADGSVVGLAEAHVTEVTGVVDIGASVLAPHRRRGLAHALVARAVAEAVAQGACQAEFLFDPDNRAAARIASALHARFCVPGHAVLHVRHPDRGMASSVAGS